MTYRILITGERSWTDEQQVHSALSALLRRLNTNDIVIVHGDCETGADRFAQNFCNENGIKSERHPADWKRLGKAAGPRRNTEMVRLGAYVCLAFWSGEKVTGSGTFDCLTKALCAGIRVMCYPRVN